MPDPQKQDYFSQFEEPKSDYFSQFEEVPAVKEEDKPSLFDRLQSDIDAGKKYINETPILRRFFFGPNEEDLGGKKLEAPTMSPGEIPGVKKGVDYIANKLMDTGSYPLGYAGGLLKEFLPGMAESAFDPSNAAVRDVPIPTRGSAIIPEVVKETPIAKPEQKLLASQKLLGTGVTDAPYSTTPRTGGVYNVSPSEDITLPTTRARMGTGRFGSAGATAHISGEAGVPVTTDEVPTYSARERLAGDFKDNHVPTNAEGVVTVKNDAKLEPQIKQAEIVSEPPIPETEPLKSEAEAVKGPEVKVRPEVQAYIDAMKSGAIDAKTTFSDFKSNQSSLMSRLKSEQGSIIFKRMKGVPDAEANKVREEIINTLLQGGRLDLEGIYGRTAGINRKQFNSIVDEIIDTGAVPKAAEEVRINTPQPIQRLLSALSESRVNSALQAAQLSAERGQRLAAFGRTLSEGEGGKAGFFKAARQMSGEYNKVSPTEFALGQEDTDALFQQIKNNPRISNAEKLRAGFALRDLLDGTRVLQRNELALMDRVYGPGVGQQIFELHGGLGAVPIQLAKTANTMKSMMASIDLSAPFRQGAGLVHRKEFWNAFVQMFKYAKSHDAFVALQRSIESDPNYLFSRDSGLFTASHEMANFEEQFGNSYLNDIRDAGKFGKAITEPFAASERAYVGFLNKLRFDTFNSLIQKAEKAGLETFTTEKVGVPESGFTYKKVAGEKIKIFNEYRDEKIPSALSKEIANYVNVSTGRGDLGRFNKYADDLNTVLFSPKLIASRLTILNPKYYVNASPFVRTEALKTLMGLAGISLTVSSLGAILGGETKLKPTVSNMTNPDYAKVRWNKTRLDPNSGFGQYIVAATQFLTGQSTSSVSGNTYPLGAGYGQQTRLGKLIGIGGQNPSFLENKLSPMFALADNILSGRTDPNGRPMSVPTEVGKAFVPLLIQDMWALYQTDPDLLPLAIPASMGMGLQTYQDRPAKTGLPAPKMSTGRLRP